MWGGGHMFGMGFGWFFWILLIAVIVWFVLRTTSQRSGAGSSTNSPNDSEESAREILDKRFARGQIDEKEYKQRKKDLESS